MSKVVAIDQIEVGEGRPVFIIAEIGDTHGGSEDRALKLVETAAKAGANAVKLQTISADDSYVPGTPSHRAFTQLWLNKSSLIKIQRACRDRGMLFFSTPGEFGTLELLLEMNVPLIKISSGLMTNLPLVERAAATGKPLLISTGMSTMEEVKETVQTAEAAGCSQMMLMHCTSIYPAPAHTLNLCAIETLAGAFDCPIGYSDHYDGIEACLAAVALGARVLEKHVTLDKNGGGPSDHLAADPEQLKVLVSSVRAVERMLGDGNKRPVETEFGGRDTYRRCLVAKRPIGAGESFTVENIGLKRPAGGSQGLPPRWFNKVLGKQAGVAIAQETSIQPEMVAGGIDGQ